MTKSDLTAAPPIAVIPDVAKSDPGASSSTSETDLHRSGLKKDGVTFDTTGLKARFYKPIDRYEGHHRYDPDFEWEPEEERKVVRKVPCVPTSSVIGNFVG